MSGSLASTDWPGELRALLVLGRISNLPTIWSNCLAGWILSGGGTLRRFGLLCLGATCLYLGGMFLNDAFDAGFDRQYRKERPVPSGKISLGQVWGWGLGWLIAGLLLISLLGLRALALAGLLVGCILLYDAVHKAVTLSPVLMALCRWLVYLLAGVAAETRLQGLVVWCGLAMALYVLGLSCFARGERFRGPVPYWPTALLAAPILLAEIVNGGGYALRAALFSIVLAIWVVRCLLEVYWISPPRVGRAVSGLLAGICLVDLLAVLGGTAAIGGSFLVLFVLCVFGQRFIPAT